MIKLPMNLRTKVVFTIVLVSLILVWLYIILDIFFPFINSLKIFGRVTNQDSLLLTTLR